MRDRIFEAKIENLDAVLSFVSEELDAAGCRTKVGTQIAIAVEEIFVNIASYAYNPGVGDVAIRVAAGKDATIEFEDSGKPYNPLEKQDPDITADAKTREVGGLGIFMAKKIMDTIEYRYESGKNMLRIKKALD